MFRLTALVWLAGCAPNDGPGVLSDTGTDTGTGGTQAVVSLCDDLQTPMTLDETSSLDFIPQDVVDIVIGEHVFSAPWFHDDTQTVELTLAFTLAGDTIYHDLSTTSESTLAQAACADHITIPVDITLSTDDGAFAETLRGEIWTRDLTDIELTAEWAVQDTTGTWTTRPEHVWAWDSTQMTIYATWDDTFDGLIAQVSEGLKDGEMVTWIQPVLMFTE